MKQSFITFIHKPKQVITVSLVLALAIGIFGYVRIHQAPTYQFVTAGPGTIQGSDATTVRNLSLGFLTGGRIKTVAVKVGDSVTAGEVLSTIDAGNALGAVAQAKAAYETAQANQQKVINGATGATIDVAKAAVNTAQVNLDQATKQQTLLVANAKRTYLNSTITAKSTSPTTLTPPTITGTYTGDAEGSILLTVDQGGSTSGGYFSLSGLVTATGDISTTNAQPLSTTGLSIQFPTLSPYVGSIWEIDVPNTNAPNYLANNNAYQTALATHDQVVDGAQATLDAAKTALTATVTAARPEDIASAQAQVDSAYGALEIAQASYNNTIITAPTDGTVTAISIAPGQIATPNTSALTLVAHTTSHSVSVMVPESAIISRNGKNYVEKKSENTVTEVEVNIGATDETSAEITSGLAAGDQVVSH